MHKKSKKYFNSEFIFPVFNSILIISQNFRYIFQIPKCIKMLDPMDLLSLSLLPRCSVLAAPTAADIGISFPPPLVFPKPQRWIGQPWVAGRLWVGYMEDI